MQSDEKNYFASRSKDEDYPFVVDSPTSIRYVQLEKIFNSFFPEDYLSIAKEKSRQERDSKKINDSSFTYGEIVYNFLYNNVNYSTINLDIQINGIHI